MAQQEEVLNTSFTSVEPSPMRKKRIEEKEELAHLNDRLLDYIQQVRGMKDVNFRLEAELQLVKEQLGKESESVKLLYEAELADARTLIDETAKEKARQQILTSKSVARVEELEAELKALQVRLNGVEGQLAVAERAAASSEAQRKAIQEEKTKLQKQVKDLEVEVADLQAQIASLRESMESETLSKVDLQNNIQSLREELAFRKKVYEEELTSLQTKLENTSVESVDLGHILDSRLEAAIEELREKSEMEIAQYKLEVEAAYKDKIATLEAQSEKDVSTITRINTELRKTSSTLGESNGEIVRLQKTSEKAATLLRAKEEELINARQGHTEEVSCLVAELRQLRESYEVKIKEYEELMDIRIQLDQEIATYRALLHEEETRLNITPTPPREKRTRHRAPMSEPVPKRARLHQQEEQAVTTTSTTGFIQVCDVDPAGKFIQIKNMSTQIESLGKFKIQHQVEGGGEVVFRFHPKSKLQGGHSVTVWGSKAEGAVHSPPDNIIWKGADNWGSGEKTVTKLVSPSGDVVATFTQRSEVKVTPVKSKLGQSKASPSSLADASSRSYPSLPEQSG
jgi:chromosome segregation ATPase